MSAEWGFVCLSHNPPIHSEGWAREHRLDQLAWVYRNREQLIAWHRLAGSDGSWVDFTSGPIVFLREHPHCHVAFSGEDGAVRDIEHGQQAEALS